MQRPTWYYPPVCGEIAGVEQRNFLELCDDATSVSHHLSAVFIDFRSFWEWHVIFICFKRDQDMIVPC